MKKLLVILMLLTVLPVAACSKTEEKTITHSITVSDVPVYYGVDQFMPVEEMKLMPDFKLYYADGVSDLPYVDLSDFVALINILETADSVRNTGDTTAKKGRLRICCG